MAATSHQKPPKKWLGGGDNKIDTATMNTTSKSPEASVVLISVSRSLLFILLPKGSSFKKLVKSEVILLKDLLTNCIDRY